MLFYPLCVFVSLLCCIDGKVLKTKIVILGAGASGISAARTLKNANIHDFLIVDGQSFVGGRVQHAAFGNSVVELGANWIYGKGQNPIHKLALSHGLLTTPNDKTNVMYFDDYGLMKDQSQGKNISDEFEQVQMKLVEYAERRLKRKQVDLSSRSALNLIGWRPDTPLKAAVEYFNIDWEFSEPAEMCSLDYATGTMDTVTGTYPFGNEFVVDKRGFNHILKEEAKTILDNENTRLLLNTVVTKISYNDQNVTIFTANGDTIEAEYAICTFSLGVLQSDTVEFEPTLPEWKRESLMSFHMTTYTKIFLKFNHRFWGNWQFALYANNVTRHGGYYTVWQNLNAPGYLFQGSSTDHILMVTTTDKESQRIENMSDSQVKQEIMQVLQRMFPSQQIEPPTDILIPRWHQHPLFKGTYSNWPIGALTKHHSNMRAPLHNRLWFAGEAMSADYYGFLHGAWFEGESVAQSISRCILEKCPFYERYEYVTGCDEEKPKFYKQF